MIRETFTHDINPFCTLRNELIWEGKCFMPVDLSPRGLGLDPGAWVLIVRPVAGVAFRSAPGGFPEGNPGFRKCWFLWTKFDGRRFGAGLTQFLFEHTEPAIIFHLWILSNEIDRHFLCVAHLSIEAHPKFSYLGSKSWGRCLPYQNQEFSKPQRRSD